MDIIKEEKTIPANVPRDLLDGEFKDLNDFRADLASAPLMELEEAENDGKDIYRSEHDLRQPVNEYGLTPKQEEFCKAYVLVTDFNDRMALELSGHKITSRCNKHHLIRKLKSLPAVKKRIKQLIKERDDFEILDRTWILKKLKVIVEKNEKNPGTQLKALELLGKHLKMFTENINIEENNSKDAATMAAEAFAKRRKEIMEATREKITTEESILSQVKI